MMKRLLACGLIMGVAAGCSAADGVDDHLAAEDGADLTLEAAGVSPLPPVFGTPTEGLWSEPEGSFDTSVPLRCRQARAYVARLKGTACASLRVPGWLASPVFSGEPDPKVKAAFCRFTWSSPGVPGSADVSALGASLSAVVYKVKPSGAERAQIARPDLRAQCPAGGVVLQPPGGITLGDRTAGTGGDVDGRALPARRDFEAPGPGGIPTLGEPTCDSCASTGEAQTDEGGGPVLVIASSRPARARIAAYYVALPPALVSAQAQHFTFRERVSKEVLGDVEVPAYAQNFTAYIRRPTQGPPVMYLGAP